MQWKKNLSNAAHLSRGSHRLLELLVMRTATLQGLLKDGNDPVPTLPTKGLVFVV